MSIYTKGYFWVGVADRAIKTLAQTLVALIGTSAVAIHALDWPMILSVAATATLLSVLTSVATPDTAANTKVMKNDDGDMVAYIPKHSQDFPRS